MDSGLQQSQVVREFVDFRRGDVLCRSSVAAKFMLGQVLDPNVLTEIDVVDGVMKRYRKRSWGAYRAGPLIAVLQRDPFG